MLKDTLLKLLTIPGPSGFEGACADYIESEMRPCADEIRRDVMGNLVCVKKGAPGGKRILLAIALTALVTGLVLWFFFPNGALMGASGVVFMLIVLASFAGMRTGTIPLTLILVLILYLGGEIFQAVTGSAGLAQLTHIAGGVLGMIFGFTWSRGKRGGR